MKRLITFALCMLFTATASAQPQKALFRGFDGGMMVHSGYLSGTLDAIGYQAKGALLGIGGVIRLHLGEHFRVGSDFIVSGPMHLTLKLDYLCALSQSSILPHGPRVYVGFLFYH